jgi:hypothetical protein
MAIEYNGSARLIIWNLDLTYYYRMYRDGLSLPFQPAKGMRLVSESNHYEIHDIEWDLEDGTFDFMVVEREYHLEGGPIDIAFLIEEAERVGWKKQGDSTDYDIDGFDRFCEFCFPEHSEEIERIGEMERQMYDERFKETVLDALTSLKFKIELLSFAGRKAALTGAIAGAVTFIIVSVIF